MTRINHPIIAGGGFIRLAIASLLLALGVLALTASAGAAGVAVPDAEADAVAISFSPPADDSQTPQIATCSRTVTSHRQISTQVINGATWRQFEDHISRSCTDGVDRSYNTRYWLVDGSAGNDN